MFLAVILIILLALLLVGAVAYYERQLNMNEVRIECLRRDNDELRRELTSRLPVHDVSWDSAPPFNVNDQRPPSERKVDDCHPDYHELGVHAPTYYGD